MLWHVFPTPLLPDSKLVENHRKDPQPQCAALLTDHIQLKLPMPWLCWDQNADRQRAFHHRLRWWFCLSEHWDAAGEAVGASRPQGETSGQGLGRHSEASQTSLGQASDVLQALWHWTMMHMSLGFWSRLVLGVSQWQAQYVQGCFQNPTVVVYLDHFWEVRDMIVRDGPRGLAQTPHFYPFFACWIMLHPVVILMFDEPINGIS